MKRSWAQIPQWHVVPTAYPPLLCLIFKLTIIAWCASKHVQAFHGALIAAHAANFQKRPPVSISEKSQWHKLDERECQLCDYNEKNETRVLFIDWFYKEIGMLMRAALLLKLMIEAGVAHHFRLLSLGKGITLLCHVRTLLTWQTVYHRCPLTAAKAICH